MKFQDFLDKKVVKEDMQAVERGLEGRKDESISLADAISNQAKSLKKGISTNNGVDISTSLKEIKRYIKQIEFNMDQYSKN